MVKSVKKAKSEKLVDKPTPVRKHGEKFVDKYGVSGATCYRDDGSFNNIEIPPPGHFLYDEDAPRTFDPIRVAVIDRDGHMNDPIEVWTDKDASKLWVLDGRGRKLDVEEVNRRRAVRKCEPVRPLLIPFGGDEKAAVARVRSMNYHRRVPKVSTMAVDLLALRKAGHTWDSCAETLHVEVEHTEAWGKKLLPLAFCVPEVRALFDSGDLPRSKIKLFAGSAPDGSEAKGKKEQLALITELLVEKQTVEKPKTVTPKKRAKVVVALQNGASASLSSRDRDVAEAVAAALRLVDGEEDALEKWPEVAAIVKEAMSKSKKAAEDVDSETEE